MSQRLDSSRGRRRGARAGLAASGPLQAALRRWLSAEREGREDAAESALARVFASLPEASPGAGFADRVLAAAGIGRPAAAYPWWSRAAIAASLVLAGLTLAWAVPLVLALGRLVAPAEVAGALVRGFVALVSRLDEALSIWRFFAGVADTLMLIVTAPPVVWTLLALTALAAFTLRGLSELLSSGRSPAYVQVR